VAIVVVVYFVLEGLTVREDVRLLVLVVVVVVLVVVVVVLVVVCVEVAKVLLNDVVGGFGGEDEPDGAADVLAIDEMGEVVLVLVVVDVEEGVESAGGVSVLADLTALEVLGGCVGSSFFKLEYMGSSSLSDAGLMASKSSASLMVLQYGMVNVSLMNKKYFFFSITLPTKYQTRNQTGHRQLPSSFPHRLDEEVGPHVALALVAVVVDDEELDDPLVALALKRV